MRKRNGADFTAEQWRNIWGSLWASLFYVLFCAAVISAIWPSSIVLQVLSVVAGYAFCVTPLYLCYFLTSTRLGYFVADFPPSRQGKLLFVLLIPWWPFLTLPSWIRMKEWEKTHAKACQRVIEEAERETESSLSQGTMQQYFQFRSAIPGEHKMIQVLEAQKALQETQRRRAEVQTLLDKVDADLDKAKKAYTEATERVIPELSDDDLMAEWQAILNVQSVSKMMLSQRYVSGQITGSILSVIIAVRVEYEGALYDLGDYQLDLHPVHYRLEKVRTGMWHEHERILTCREYRVFKAAKDALSDLMANDNYVLAIQTVAQILSSCPDEELPVLQNAYYSLR